MPGAEIVQRRMDRCSLVRLQYRRKGLLSRIVYLAQWIKMYAFLVGFKLLSY